MEMFILDELNRNEKLMEYLKKHSYWCEKLDADWNNYKVFLSEFKKQKRSETYSKINDTIDNIELLSNLL